MDVLPESVGRIDGPFFKEVQLVVTITTATTMQGMASTAQGWAKQGGFGDSY